MRIIVLLLTIVVLTGCAQSGYKQFYTPYVDAKTLPDSELISEEKQPKILYSDNLDRDILTLQSKKYIAVGYSSFNGRYEKIQNAAEQAKRVGATIVLVSSKYTNTQTTTTTLLLPDNKTTYHSGTIYTNSSYKSTQGTYLGNSTTNGVYNGTSTTFGTKAVPLTTQQHRYDQTAVYFVKSNEKLKFGLYFKDLTPKERAKIERNTGVLINVVVEDSPAFNSNVLAGDILIAVDGINVKNAKHAGKLMGNVAPHKTHSTLKVIRKGKEKEIQVQF